MRGSARGSRPNYQSVNNEDPYKSILEDPDVGLDLHNRIMELEQNKRARDNCKEFLAYLHNKGVPVKQINSVLRSTNNGVQAISTTINGLAPVSSIQTILLGFPQAQPRLFAPIMAGGLFTQYTASINATMKLLGVKKGEKYLEDSATLAEGINSATFSLRTIIAFYIWFVTNEGKSHQEVDASYKTFIALVLCGAIPAAAYVALSIRNTHSPLQSKAAIAALGVLNVIPKSVVIQDLIANAIGFSNYSIQLAAFMSSLVAGVVLSAVSFKSPKKVAAMINTLSAINLSYIFYRLWEELKNDNTISDTQRYLLLMMYTSSIIIPFATYVVVEGLCKKLRATEERKPLLEEDIENGMRELQRYGVVYEGLTRDEDEAKYTIVELRNTEEEEKEEEEHVQEVELHNEEDESNDTNENVQEVESDNEEDFSSDHDEEVYTSHASSEESETSSSSDEEEVVAKTENEKTVDVEGRQKVIIEQLETILHRVEVLEREELAEKQKAIIKQFEAMSDRVAVLERKELTEEQVGFLTKLKTLATRVDKLEQKLETNNAKKEKEGISVGMFRKK